MKLTDLTSAKDLGNGIHRQMLLNGGVVAFNITSVSHEAIDTWIKAQCSLLEAWPEDRPVCILGDQSSMEHLTPYMKSRFSDIARAARGKSGRVAVVVGKGFFTQLATMFFKTTGTGGMHLRFFVEREQAMAWLQEII